MADTIFWGVAPGYDEKWPSAKTAFGRALKGAFFIQRFEPSNIAVFEQILAGTTRSAQLQNLRAGILICGSFTQSGAAHLIRGPKPFVVAERPKDVPEPSRFACIKPFRSIFLAISDHVLHPVYFSEIS